MKSLRIASGVAVLAIGLTVMGMSGPATTVAASGKAGDGDESAYRVLKPIESGDLTLFPVVRVGKGAAGDPFLTLDEGLRSGEVEVTEAGNVRGLVRSRGGAVVSRGDQVNTLVLVNHSKKPLLLLAGEIVTGGKQDRIVASDRIVPADSDPVDLSVFCIEHGRWTPTSDKFGVTANAPAQSFMVQPEVRQQAMVAKSQQQVWDSVSGAITNMAVAAAPLAVRPANPGSTSETISVSRPEQLDTVDATTSTLVSGRSLGTTSYAKAMQMGAVSEKVDQVAAETVNAREQVLAQLKQENAVGVVVAVHGEIIWADVFGDTNLLTRYWTKLVRSYAAEGLTPASYHGAEPTQADAQKFLDTPMRGAETSQGEVGVYRCLEARAGTIEQFVLESLLPQFQADVHLSRLKVRGVARVQPATMIR